MSSTATDVSSVNNKDKFENILRQIRANTINEVDLSCSSDSERKRLFITPLDELGKYSDVLEQMSAIYSVKLNGETMQRLAEALKENTSVVSLKLHHCNIFDKDVSVLAKALASTRNIKIIDFGQDNFIGPDGARALLALTKEKRTIETVTLNERFASSTLSQQIKSQLGENIEANDQDAAERLVYARTFFQAVEEDSSSYVQESHSPENAAESPSTPQHSG